MTLLIGHARLYPPLKLWRPSSLYESLTRTIRGIRDFRKSPPLRDVKRLFSHVIPSRARGQQRDVHRLEFKSRLISVRGEVSFGCLEPILVVAVGEVRFVMRAARLVAHGRALGDHARELKHVVQL